MGPGHFQIMPCISIGRIQLESSLVIEDRLAYASFAVIGVSQIVEQRRRRSPAGDQGLIILYGPVKISHRIGVLGTLPNGSKASRLLDILA